MMEATDASTTAAQSSPGRVRWQRIRPASAVRRLPAWRLWLRWSLLVAALTGLAIPLISWLGEPPEVEPPFERLVPDGVGPVKAFALKDVDGGLHTAAEWSGRPAVVLFFLGI